MKKLDFKKELKALYQPSARTVSKVRVPSMTYLMIDGTGDPNTSKDYAEAVEALFAVAYAVKFLVKNGPTAVDFAVMPLEGLWWADDMTDFSRDRSRWQWTVMIMQPAFVTKTMIRTAINSVKAKKTLPALAKLRVASLTEGMCAQTLHLGPFSAEGPTIEKVHRFITDQGKHRTGKHHEIYLSDIRRTAPAKWKTVVRQPMQ